MKLAFYRGRHRLFDILVQWWQRCPYSHCELVLRVVDGQAECASASFMDGGVRVKRIELDAERWDVVEIDGNPLAAALWLEDHRGEPYDLLGLLGFVWRPLKGRGRKWFCSEAVAAMLGFPEPWRFDVAMLKTIFSRKG